MSSDFGSGPPLRPPYPTSEEFERAKRERHKRWIQSLTDRDWARLSEAADRLGPDRFGDKLYDLDAPGIAVGVVPAEHARHFSGEKIGTIREGKFALLVWEKDRR